jgi:hypothetical protein
MRHLLPVGIGVAIIAAVGVMAACNDGPKRVVGPSPTPVAPSPTAPPVVVNVEISGPASIPPGQSAQFNATLRFSDGTTQTATSVFWYGGGQFFRVDASGLVTAREENGEGVLYAEVTPNGTAPPSSGIRGPTIRSSREILVLPDGTYRMVGTVSENGPEPTPVFGARVEITTGPRLVAVTDYEGRYRLYGIPPVVDIRVSRDGYQPHVQRLQLAEHATQNFQLALAAARLDLTGPYTLAIDTGCEPVSTPSGPLDLRHLRYDAVLTQRGSTVEVVLTESSRFRVNGFGRGDRFSGRVDSAGATFNLGGVSWYYYDTYPDLVERMPDGTFLVVEGMVVTRGSRAGLAGDQPRLSSNRFDSRWPGVHPLYGSFIDFCSATLPFRFTLTPR